MFHALADVWRGFIYSTAEYQTAIAAVIFSANGVRSPTDADADWESKKCHSLRMTEEPSPVGRNGWWEEYQ